jgi:sugar phosphate isomerase/epimerase
MVLCSGTLPEHATFAERIDAAVAGGFDGLSLWGRDYDRARASGLGDADMLAMLGDHGIELAELDGAWSWAPGAPADLGAGPEAGFMGYHADDFFRIADAIGGRSLNAAELFGTASPTDEFVAAFANLCDRAADHGLLVHLEFLPWSRVPDVATAWEIVQLADRRNGGILVDSWHFYFGTPDFDALRAVPGSSITGVQLNDAPAHVDDVMNDAMRLRRLPGDGDFDLDALVFALRGMGTVAPMGIEVMSEDLYRLDPVEVGRRAGITLHALLET